MEVSCRSRRRLVEEPRGSPAPEFLVAATGGGRLRLIGELDLASVPALRALLADLDGDVELDCSELTFIDCTGLRVLLETQRACEDAGVRLSLVAPSRCLTRLLELNGLDARLDVRDRSNR